MSLSQNFQDDVEAQIARTLVYQCVECKSIVGDSYSLISNNQETKSITLSSASCIQRTNEIFTSYGDYDEGSTYFVVLCQSCHQPLGRYYVTTSKDLDHVREKITFNIDSITSYELGKAHHRMGAEGKQPTCIKDSGSYVYQAGPNTISADQLRMYDAEPGFHDYSIQICTEDSAAPTIAKTNIQVRAHKFVMAARSPVFRAMLNSGMTESSANEMEIMGFSVEAVQAFVRFLYCDACTETALQHHDLELLAMADKYDVHALRCVCETYLAEHLLETTAVLILQRADQHNAPTLKRKALDFVTKNKKSVSENPAVFAGMNPSLMIEVVLALAK